MNQIFSLGLVCFAVATGCRTAPPPATGKNFTCVLVHGAWGGGCDWRHVDQLLAADGHTVFRPTLTGQGEHSNLSTTNLDLATHIQDIVNVILWENLHDVVLVGHSYGGMVITGVADRVPEHIRQLIYLDALVPTNGESANDIRPAHIKTILQDGYLLAPWVKPNTPPPHDVLMPAKCFSQPIVLTNQTAAEKIPAAYILTVDLGHAPETDDFYQFYQRAQARGWAVGVMVGDHNVQRSHPQDLVKLIEAATTIR